VSSTEWLKVSLASAPVKMPLPIVSIEAFPAKRSRKGFYHGKVLFSVAWSNSPQVSPSVY
jgi:hypothetical protein